MIAFIDALLNLSVSDFTVFQCSCFHKSIPPSRFITFLMVILGKSSEPLRVRRKGGGGVGLFFKRISFFFFAFYGLRKERSGIKMLRQGLSVWFVKFNHDGKVFFGIKPIGKGKIRCVTVEILQLEDLRFNESDK